RRPAPLPARAAPRSHPGRAGVPGRERDPRRGAARLPRRPPAGRAAGGRVGGRRLLPQQRGAQPQAARGGGGHLTMRFDIHYRTLFTYDELVRESQNELRACPTTDEHQQLISYRLSTAPSSRVFSFGDYWGTRVDAFGLRAPHVSLEVTAE